MPSIFQLIRIFLELDARRLGEQQGRASEEASEKAADGLFVFVCVRRRVALASKASAVRKLKLGQRTAEQAAAATEGSTRRRSPAKSMARRDARSRGSEKEHSPGKPKPASSERDEASGFPVSQSCVAVEASLHLQSVLRTMARRGLFRAPWLQLDARSSL